MNLSEFKAGIVAKATNGKSSDRELSVGTLFNIINSRPAFSAGGFVRVKTASDANYHANGGYYLLNIACTTTQRKAWALALVGQLAVSLGFNPTGLDEQGVKTALDSLMLSGAEAQYANEIINSTTAVAITRDSSFTRGVFVDVAFDMQLSTATGLQELRFTSISHVKADIAKAQKANIMNIFGTLEEEVEESTVISSAIVDAL